MESQQPFLLFSILQIFLISFGFSSANNAMYNVQTFGAKPDGKSDSTKAFLNAWEVACASTAPATIYVPSGRYLLAAPTLFAGNMCKNNGLTLRIDGTLVAPANYHVLGNSGNWIKIQRVNGLSIYGGTLDGQGSGLWACKNSGKKDCPSGATTLGIYNSKNVFISGLTSLNSQQFHILLDGCKNTRLEGVKISADGNSPNTDGIHVQSSSRTSIIHSHVATGDDCVSMGPGTSSLWIENIACGPGHGISIGSLGWNLKEAGVKNVTVKNATFRGTQNGLRVKTWARRSDGFVKGVLFQHVNMVNVQNPIIIDQYYCPTGSGCPNQGSGVKISDITYQDVHGSSATQVAVKIECSKLNPCTHITMDQVDLSFNNKQPSTASCSNAGGTSRGVVQPTGCL